MNVLGMTAGGRRWVSGGLQLALVSLTLGGVRPVGATASAAVPSAAPVAAAAPEGAWVAQAQSQVAQREYHASRNQRGLQAPNRTHNLRAYFAPEGVRLNDRTAPGEPELIALRLAGLGRAGAERPVPAGEVSSDGARVEIRRPGLVEWYVNGSAGIEQGFTLDRRPEGKGHLSLKLALSSGSVHSAGAGAALLRAANGRELRYAGLAVVDAQGRNVPAELRVTEPHDLRIDVDDAGAVYPLTVDPWITAVVLQSDQADAHLGVSVAGAGDVNGDGHPDVIVGAPDYDAGQTNEGAAFVFLARGRLGVVSGNPLSADGALQGNQVEANFGSSVAGAGDVNGDGYADVIVGATGYDAGQTDEGAAFVFLGGPAGIASGNPTTASSMLESNHADAGMGSSAAGAGDVNADGYADVIVGFSRYGSRVGKHIGVALVFLGGPLGIPNGGPTTASAQLYGDKVGARLGVSVAGAGDVNADGYADVIVGAPYYTSPGNAFVFLGGPSGIANGGPSTASATLVGAGQGVELGNSVASAGDVNGDGYADVIVGAPYYGPNQDAGSAFVFLGGPTGIANGNPTTANATLLGNTSVAMMGWSVAGAGDVNGDGYADVIVGAPQHMVGGIFNGGAFVFLGGPAGVANGDTTTANATFRGWSVAGAGDVNGDGYADVIVGAPYYDAGQANEGRAVVFLGGVQ